VIHHWIDCWQWVCGIKRMLANGSSRCRQSSAIVRTNDS
jgi:hypothetical protein